jgi:hypothetical protein
MVGARRPSACPGASSRHRAGRIRADRCRVARAAVDLLVPYPQLVGG